MINKLRSSVRLLVITSFCWLATYAGAVPFTNIYEDTFETYDEGTPLVDGTNYWWASDTNAIVQTNIAIEGSTQAAMIPVDVTLSNRFAEGGPYSNICLRMSARFARYDGTNTPVADTNSAVLFYLNSNGHFVVYNGSNSNWTTLTHTPVPVDAWITNLYIYINYPNQTWNMVMESNAVAKNIGFANPSITNLTGFDIYNGGGATSYLDNVSLSEAPFPYLTTEPSSVTNYTTYKTTTTNSYFDIISVGNETLSYMVVTNTESHNPVTWLQVTANSTGSLTNNDTNTVELTHPNVITNFAPGTYRTSLAVLSPEFGGSSQQVDVALVVRGLTLSTTKLQPGVMDTNTPAVQTFELSQTGAEPINYKITTNIPQDWIASVVDSGSGSIGAGETNTITVTYLTNGLSYGSHTASLEVATTSGDLTQHVEIVMTMFTPPELSVDWTQYSQTLHKGQQPVDKALTISNIAGIPRATMAYAATSSAPWLAVNTNGATTDGEGHVINVAFNNMTATNGNFNGTVWVRTVDAGTNYTPVGTIEGATQIVVQVTILQPGTPTSLTGTAGTLADGIRITWAGTSNLAHYEVWRSPTNNIATATRILASTTSTNYKDTSINPGLVYYYWVRGVNQYGGAGNFSASVSGWRLLPAPTNPTASQGDYTNKVALSWTASFGAVNYHIMRSRYNATSTADYVGTVAAAQTTYNDTTAAIQTEYYYWIAAATAQKSAWSTATTGFRSALLKPTGLQATRGTHANKVRVTWTAVSAATKYQVWRSPNNNIANAAKVGEPTITGFDDVPPSQGIPYYYWVKALNTQGSSPYSASTYGWRQIAAPSGLAASGRTYCVRVSWNSVPNATSYEVVRVVGPGMREVVGSISTEAEMEALSQNGAAETKSSETTALFYDDHATTAGARYYYKVRAKNALGAGELSSSTADAYRHVRQATTTLPVVNDFDGDRLADPTLYDTKYGILGIIFTVRGLEYMYLGGSNYVAVAGDFDGDGVADPTVYSEALGKWIAALSSMSHTPVPLPFGGPGQVPAVADFDGDRLSDLATYQAAIGKMHIMLSGYGYMLVHLPIGGAGYVPVSADFDGDGKADPAVYSATAKKLTVMLSGSGYAPITLPQGSAVHTMHPRDYDGDGKADLTVYNTTDGKWTFMLSSINYASVSIPLGGAGFQAVPDDYDGDRLIDLAVYSQTEGWKFMFSASGYATITDTFGDTNSIPLKTVGQ